MLRKQKRGLGAEGGSLGKDERWRARRSGRKEVLRGADPKEGPELKPYAVDIGRAVFQSGVLF